MWHPCWHGCWCRIMGSNKTLRWCHVTLLTHLALPFQLPSSSFSYLSPLSLMLTLGFNKILLFYSPTCPAGTPLTSWWDKGTTLNDRIHIVPLHWPKGWVGPIPHLYLRVRELSRLLDAMMKISQDRRWRGHVASQKCTSIKKTSRVKHSFPLCTCHYPNSVARYKVLGQNHFSFHVTMVCGTGFTTVLMWLPCYMLGLPRALHTLPLCHHP
jgi:hypothetical protein